MSQTPDQTVSEQVQTPQASPTEASSPSDSPEQKPDSRELFSLVGNLNQQLMAIENFVARRFDEISMEINATSQQVDMAEDGIVKRFAEILEILGAISFDGGGQTAANSGFELEAVINDTEDAANRILDAADRIADYVSDQRDWNNPDTTAEVRELIRNDVQEILLACTFQDLTGQRIRNTLDNLHQIENRLSTTFERLGIDVKVSQEQIAKTARKASSQCEIDALLTGFDAAQPAGENSAPAGQDDIDAMFADDQKSSAGN